LEWSKAIIWLQTRHWQVNLLDEMELSFTKATLKAKDVNFR